MVHLAAYYDFLGKPSSKYDEITVVGTRRLLRGLRAGFEVEQFILSSTMLIHGPGEPGEFITGQSTVVQRTPVIPNIRMTGLTLQAAARMAGFTLLWASADLLGAN